MSSESDIADGRQILGRLARGDFQGTEEVSVVASPGARVSAWSVKVKGLLSYNVYNVRTVIIGDAGSLPAEIGGQMQAVNLAESFIDEGQLPVGTYVAMFKVGDKNVFYAPV
jgi:hypothetical protein